MSKNLTHALAAVAAGAALSAFGVSGAHAPGAAADGRPSATVPTSGASDPVSVPGTQLWVQHYGDVAGDAAGLAVSPTAGTVFVTGQNAVPGAWDYGTVAYDPATGAQLWAQNFNAGGRYDYASSVAVSPTGATVFVTGQSALGTSSPYNFDYTTVAYAAATGAQLWVSRYNGPGNGYDRAASVAVSPSGSTVFVTGTSKGKTSGPDYATVAYSAAAGARKWVSRYNGPGNGTDRAVSIGVSPSGGRVFVTGRSTGAKTGADYATIAYSARTGVRKWVKRYDGSSFNGCVSNDYASGVAVSPTGSTVYVTGSIECPTEAGGHQGPVLYNTIGYTAATGAQLWSARYASPWDGEPGDRLDFARSVAVSPAGGEVYVTGFGIQGDGSTQYSTVAYSG